MKFSFGENWVSFSQRALNADRVAEARRAFQSLTRDVNLSGSRFLDIGFGQGLALFLAAESGADVYGIDVDSRCGDALRVTAEFFPTLALPRFRTASILDGEFVRRQQIDGDFDIVHSWGVLHHTGDMQRAFRNAAALVKPGGFLIISIYNRHWTSPLWSTVKWSFNHIPRFAQEALVVVFYPLFYARARVLSHGDSSLTRRGMSLRHDIRDWLGGYPYEYASIPEVEERFSRLGFALRRCDATRGFTGCNEFVFQKRTEPENSSKDL